LYVDGKAEAAVEMERRWDELARVYDVDICADIRGYLPQRRGTFYLPKNLRRALSRLLLVRRVCRPAIA
jgi:hypothetical protein